jgi:Mg2+ and Co2+ transporter CorA
MKPVQNKRNTHDKILSSQGTVLAILFFVTGFLGLPLLWMSPAFSRLEKVIWSLINILYTSVLIAVCIAICWWSYRQVFGALGSENLGL